MRVSRETVAQNRVRILEAAGRLFRERGFEDVSVAEIMKAAGLTHGAFYGYFASKDALIAETLGTLTSKPSREAVAPALYAARYLSPEHRDDRAGGCPVAALATEAARQAPEVRASLTEGLRRQIDRLDPGGTPTGRQEAIGSWAAMVGALVLARISDDPALSDEVLAATRALIEARPLSS